MKTIDLLPAEAAPFYQNYISLLDSKDDLLQILSQGIEDITLVSVLISNLKKQKFSYAPQKWTVQDIFIHLIDVERVFCYRALCISRGDQTHFPAFNENDYVDNAGANNRLFEDLLEEFLTVRRATIMLFKNFTPYQLRAVGTASNNAVSVRAIGFIVAGHLKHHITIISEKYLF